MFRLVCATCDFWAYSMEEAYLHELKMNEGKSMEDEPHGGWDVELEA